MIKVTEEIKKEIEEAINENEENRKKWYSAKLLIDAKKCIDSLSYIDIDENYNKLYTNINIEKKCEKLQNIFYINCGNLIDRYVKYKRPNDEEEQRKFRRKLKQKHKPLNKIYYQRNKRSAHSDYDYESKKYNSLTAKINAMKNELECVKNVCQEILPDEITLNYVAFDRTLYLLLNGGLEPAVNIRGNEKMEKFKNDINSIIKPQNDFDDINEKECLKNVWHCVLNPKTEEDKLHIEQDEVIRHNIKNKSKYGLRKWTWK